MKQSSPKGGRKKEIEFREELRTEVGELKESALELLRSMVEFRTRLRVLASKSEDPRMGDIVHDRLFGPSIDRLTQLCKDCFNISIEEDHSAGTRRLRRLIQALSSDTRHVIPPTDSYERAEADGLPVLPDDLLTPGLPAVRKRKLPTATKLIDLIQPPSSTEDDKNAQTIAMSPQQVARLQDIEGVETIRVSRTTGTHPRKRTKR